jgi:predicted nucleic acid-binding protein
LTVQIVIDACVLVALINPRDIWHAQAEALIDAVEAIEATPINFDCAVAEAASVLVRRLSEKGRSAEASLVLQELDAHAPSQFITWILPDVPRLYAQVLPYAGISRGTQLQ